MQESENQELARNLKSRHIQLMAIGGTIGTGLFLGAGQSIHLAGPSILLAYLMAGGMCFMLMRALGELLMSDLSQHSFIDFIKKYLGDSWGFVTGWTYWICWAALAMAEVTAVGTYIRFWLPNVAQWIPGLLTLVILLLVNLISVGLFGEAEFWFALIKVVAIIALIAIGIVLIGTSYKTPSGHASLANLVNYGGFFPKGASGFFMAFQMVVFSFTGIELVGLTASETADPKKTIPDAINKLPIRVILFYIGALLVIMAIYPWNTVSANNSPFVTVFSNIGINAAADIVNFVVLTAAASACNSGLYSTGRMLFSLSLESKSPRLHRMSKLSRRQVPSRALIASAAVIGIAVILNIFLPASVFTLVTSVATISFLFVWVMIVLTHLKFRKAHPQGGDFKAPWHPFGDYYVLAFLAMVVIVMLFSRETAIAEGLAVIWIGSLYFTRKHRHQKSRK